MKVDNVSIYEALSLLRTVCAEYDDCAYCPLRYVGDSCGLLKNGRPQDWKLIPPDEYKAFN